MGLQLKREVVTVDITQSLRQLRETLAAFQPFPDTLRFTTGLQAPLSAGGNVKIIRQILPVVPQALCYCQLLSAGQRAHLPSCRRIYTASDCTRTSSAVRIIHIRMPTILATRSM